MATVTVLYPAGELDLEYYMTKHVPLVAECVCPAFVSQDV